MKKQNINKGDELLCRTTLSNKYIDIFKKGKYYIVWEILVFNDPSVYTYYICDETGMLTPFRYDEKILYKYFYSKNDVRNMKLKNLENDE